MRMIEHISRVVGYLNGILMKKELDECLEYIRSPVIPPDPSQVCSVIFLLVSDLSQNMLIIEVILNY